LRIGLANQTNSPKLASSAKTLYRKAVKQRDKDLRRRISRLRSGSLLCLFAAVLSKEKNANLKIVKYLHFLFTGYAWQMIILR